MLNEKLLAKALSYSHVREDPQGVNREILQFFHTAGHSWVESDETPWCSAFMCHVVHECLGAMPMKHRLRARSWLTLGGSEATPILGALRPGDVTILYRNGRHSVYGHVGLYCSHSADGRWIYLLGGNQSNRVCIKPYPAYRFLEGRRIL